MSTQSRTAIDKNDAQRLRDQLRVYLRAKQVETKKLARKLDEIAFYPQHDKRRETPEYKAVHNRLVVKEDRACLVCGVRKSTLQDLSKNLYGAKQMETHHRIVEWALANAIDVDKFNKHLRPSLMKNHPNRTDYQSDFTQEQVQAWVDHDPDNLWVLCDVHHRAKYFGIHEITYPIWGPVDLLRDDFEDYVRQQLAAAKSVRKSVRPSQTFPKRRRVRAPANRK